MKFRPATTNALVHRLYPKLTWRVPTKEQKIYLTFDDGPTPNVTEWVLEQLAAYDAKATFFCIGQNVLDHPEIFNKIKAAGHSIGNHTHTHPNGWEIPFEDYIENVRQCGAVFGTHLFRPPYGKITRQQSNAILSTPELLGASSEKANSMPKIIMWNVLSWDFDTEVSPEQCLKNVLSNVTPGAIIVFHDSEKAYPNMSYALPKVLEYFAEKGYRFERLL